MPNTERSAICLPSELAEPEAFIETFGIIRTQTGGLEPLIPWDWQRHFLRESGDRDIHDKSRNIGSSAIIVCRDATRSLWEGGDILIAANKEDNAVNLLSIARTFLENLPFGISFGKDNETELEIPPPFDFKLKAIARPMSAKLSGAGRSERCKRLIGTEMAFWPSPEEYWASVTGALVPGGTIALESTHSSRRSLFYRMCEEAKAGTNGYNYFQNDYHANPLHDAAWEAQRRSELTERQFAQEYECNVARFDDNQVFRYVNERCTEQPLEPEQGREYVMGLDVARVKDWWVQTVFRVPVSDERFVQVWLERFRRVDWQIMEQRAETLARRYNNTQIWMDATGVGDPEEERLRKRGLRVQGINFGSGPIKANMVDNLALMMEQNTIGLLDDPVQKDELHGYEYTILPSGRARHEAASGQHDDIVTADMLAAWGAVQRPVVRAERHAPFARI